MHPCTHCQARRAGPGPKLSGACMWPQQAECRWAGGMTAAPCMHSRLPGMSELAVPNSRAGRRTGDGRSGMPRQGRSEHRACACRCMCRTRLRRRSGRLAAGRRVRAQGTVVPPRSGAPRRGPQAAPDSLTPQLPGVPAAPGRSLCVCVRPSTYQDAPDALRAANCSDAHSRGASPGQRQRRQPTRTPQSAYACAASPSTAAAAAPRASAASAARGGASPGA
jgi:hypothetical protein